MALLPGCYEAGEDIDGLSNCPVGRCFEVSRAQLSIEMRYLAS